MSGQDGSYLSKFLLTKDYDIWGTSRDFNKMQISNLKRLGVFDKIKFVSVGCEDFDKLFQLISKVLPDEIYYLAGQSSVGLSFNDPKETISSNVMGVLNVLEVCRIVKKEIRTYNVDSMWGLGTPEDLKNYLENYK